MSLPYSKVNWQDSPSTATPLSAANLNKMDQGIQDLSNQRAYQITQMTTTAVSLAATGTPSLTAWQPVNTALDLVFTNCSAGSIVEVSLDLNAPTDANNPVVFDFVTVVSGTNTTYFSGGGAKYGLPALTINAGDANPKRSVTHRITLSSGDIATDGSCTVRLVYQNLGTTARSINASADNPLFFSGTYMGAVVQTTGTGYVAGTNIQGITVSTTPPSSPNLGDLWLGSSVVSQVGGSPGTSGSAALIGTQVLTASAATISFTSIPQTYKHLELWIQARCDQTATQGIALQFNADSATNYFYQYVQGTASTASSAAVTGATNIKLGGAPGTGATAGANAFSTVTIPNYAGTSWWKPVRVNEIESDGTTLWVNDIGGFWKSTAAVTEIDITLAAGNFVAGSTAHLYGY